MTAPVLQVVRKHEQESPFLCSACGADRGCDCSAPALRRTSADTIADRERKQRQREKVKQDQASVPMGQDIEKIEKLGAAVGKWAADHQSPWAAHGEPTPDDDGPLLPKKVERSNTMNVFRMNCYASVELAHYDGPMDDTIIKACHDAVQAWTALLTQLKERCHGSKEKEGSR